jgi:hypothetical protein
MGTIADLAERMWAGELDVVHEHHPVAARYPEAEEIVDGVLVYLSTASANTLDTGDGLVMLDTGAPYDVDALYGQVRRWRPDEPLAAAVYSHHHIDHVFGTARFEQEAAERGRPRPATSTATCGRSAGTCASTSASSGCTGWRTSLGPIGTATRTSRSTTGSRSAEAS